MILKMIDLHDKKYDGDVASTDASKLIADVIDHAYLTVKRIVEMGKENPDSVLRDACVNDILGSICANMIAFLCGHLTQQMSNGDIIVQKQMFEEMNRSICHYAGELFEYFLSHTEQKGEELNLQ